MTAELVVDNVNHPPPRLADLGVKVECKKCKHRWAIEFGQVFGHVDCPQCTGKKNESGTG